MQLCIIQIYRILVLTYADKNNDICSEHVEPSNKMIIIHRSQQNDHY